MPHVIVAVKSSQNCLQVTFLCCVSTLFTVLATVPWCQGADHWDSMHARNWSFHEPVTYDLCACISKRQERMGARSSCSVFCDSVLVRWGDLLNWKHASIINDHRAAISPRNRKFDALVYWSQQCKYWTFVNSEHSDAASFPCISEQQLIVTATLLADVDKLLDMDREHDAKSVNFW
jgi:hypothetical protein